MATMFSTIVKNLNHGPRTRLYPAEKRELPAGCRGHIEWDMEKCVFCTLCAKRCPANAISVDRKGKTLVFNPFRCIVCESCLEGCAKDAISLFEHWRAPAAGLFLQTYAKPQEEKTK